MNLFVYGTLMEPRVMAAVAGRAPAPIPAIVHDHARYTVAGEVYPGMTPEAGAQVVGILYLDLDHEELRRLDRFEGDFYQRSKVQVETQDSQRLPAFTYLVKPQYRHRLAPERWDFDAFLRDGLGRFLSDYAGFRQR